MPQEGSFMMVPDKLTGAQTTDGKYYVGATKAGNNGAGYVFGYFPASVPAGEGLGVTAHTDYTNLWPWVFTAGSGSTCSGYAESSVPASSFGWIKTAGTMTVSCQTGSFAANALCQVTNTAGSWYAAAATTANRADGDHVLGKTRYAKVAHTASTTVAIYLVPRG